MKTTQRERILEYMQRFGSITQLDAIRDLGCQRLGARIFELKQDGYDIVDEFIAVKNRYGETVHIKRYMLTEVANESHIPGY